MTKRKGQKMEIYRQGDVALVRVTGRIGKGEEVPRDEHGRIVLAYGEVTGHAHAIMDPGATLIALGGTERILRVNKPVSLRHEEHGPIHLPRGNWRVLRQREYTPEEVRYVAD